MLRVSLDDMVLQILLLDKGDPAEFLASAVNPPTELAVSNSIKYLCELQVIMISGGAFSNVFLRYFLSCGSELIWLSDLDSPCGSGGSVSVWPMMLIYDFAFDLSVTANSF